MITRDQVTESWTNHFVAEASTLGLPPGEWPAVLPTSLGNGNVLIQESSKNLYGELASVLYRQAGGYVELEILND